MWMVQAMEKSVDEASATMDGIYAHYLNWKSAIRQARTSLQTAISDALLTAAYVIYCGPLSQTVRDSLLSDWLGRCKTSNYVAETAAIGNNLLPDASQMRYPLVSSENYSVEEVVGVARLVPELERFGMLTDGCSRHNMALLYSCLFRRGLQPARCCTLLVDSDHQAQSYIRFILECVSTRTSSAFSSGESICVFAEHVDYIIRLLCNMRA